MCSEYAACSFEKGCDRRIRYTTPSLSPVRKNRKYRGHRVLMGNALANCIETEEVNWIILFSHSIIKKDI